MKILIQYLILGILLSRCSSGSDKNSGIELSKVPWKYGEGLNVGDWLDFGPGVYTMQHDTIFENNRPIAVVLSIKRGSFGDDDEMEIVSINGKERGIYHSK